MLHDFPNRYNLTTDRRFNGFTRYNRFFFSFRTPNLVIGSQVFGDNNLPRVSVMTGSTTLTYLYLHHFNSEFRFQMCRRGVFFWTVQTHNCYRRYNDVFSTKWKLNTRRFILIAHKHQTVKINCFREKRKVKWRKFHR